MADLFNHLSLLLVRQGFLESGATFRPERRSVTCHRRNLTVKLMESGGQVTAEFWVSGDRICLSLIANRIDFQVLLRSISHPTGPNGPTGQTRARNTTPAGISISV